MPVTVHVDHAALGRILKSHEVRAATERAADSVADNARGEGIRVGDLTVDRVGTEIDLPVETNPHPDGTVAVIFAHPAGVAVQAKHGTLTRAASAAGLKVQG